MEERIETQYEDEKTLSIELKTIKYEQGFERRLEDFNFLIEIKKISGRSWNIKGVAENGVGVYIVYGYRDFPLYVGETGESFRKRFYGKDHMEKKSLFDAVANRIEFYEIDDVHQRLLFERMQIARLKPLINSDRYDYIIGKDYQNDDRFKEIFSYLFKYVNVLNITIENREIEGANGKFIVEIHNKIIRELENIINEKYMKDLKDDNGVITLERLEEFYNNNLAKDYEDLL